MNNNKNSLLQQFQKLQKIGSGLTSTVYKATHLQMKQVCLKVIDQKFYSKSIGKLLIDNEIKILKQLGHKNLLKLRKHQENQNQNIIITDYCEGGSLYDLTKKCKKFTQKQTLMIVQGIVSGLSQLYSKNIIHRDLKPQNIFFMKGQPIVADFGFAVHLDNRNLNKINAGSPLYMSPQALQNLDFSLDSEVFSIGVMIFQMLEGKTPWNGQSQKQLLRNVTTIKPKLQLTNKGLQYLILKCLQPKKQQRAKFPQIVKFFDEWKNQYFKQAGFLREVRNTKKFNEQPKQIKSKKVLQLNEKPKRDKQNAISANIQIVITKRLSVGQKSHNRNVLNFTETDVMKTRKNKSDKLEQDFRMILARLDPQKIDFLTTSMIQKFKFILQCYSRLLQIKQSVREKNIPKGLVCDKFVQEIKKCKDQKQLCQSISSYIGRMYRLAKNYNIYQQFIKDIEVLYLRVQSFC